MREIVNVVEMSLVGLGRLLCRCRHPHNDATHDAVSWWAVQNQKPVCVSLTNSTQFVFVYRDFVITKRVGVWTTGGR